MDRRKTGLKHHVIVDVNDIPLAARATGSRRHDVTQLLPLVDPVPAVRGKVGRPRRRLGRLYADPAYDSGPHREALRRPGHPTVPCPPRQHARQRVGRLRWVSERTLSWLHQFRRLRIHWEVDDAMHEAFLKLGCVVNCNRKLKLC